MKSVFKQLGEVMDYMQELLAVDHLANLEFFVVELRDTIEGHAPDEQELLYISSVVGHYAMVSARYPDHRESWENFRGNPLSNFTQFSYAFPTLGGSYNSDPEALEAGGAQILLLGGFFHDQMQRRYSIRWYRSLGKTFYQQASELEETAGKKQLLQIISVKFDYWSEKLVKMSRNLRDRRYIIQPRN